MRTGVILVAIAAWSTTAAADTFGGFSAVDRVYRVNADRVCALLPVDGGKASGVPQCDKRAADALAQLAIAAGIAQTGGEARFTASNTGKTLTVSNADGNAVVVWDASDPIDKIVGVWTTSYEDRVAVAFGVRRLGRAMTDVVAFELVKTMGTASGSSAAPPVSGPDPASQSSTVASPEDPKVTAAVAAAKKATKGKALAAWQAVLALDGRHAEALYRVAVEQASGKQQAAALAALQALAASGRDDAVEWLVEARFDPAFAALRGDPKFRAAVGLDRAATTIYERLMGLGGQWEQTGTSCDKPEVRLRVMRDRSFRLAVRTVCEGNISELPFKGIWRIDGDQLVLTLPTKGQQATAKDDAPCKFERSGDEDALHCSLGHDIEFVVLPTRR
jgi:hypothetical protein